ncbi:hypothetical protein CQZ88_22820 [Rhodococcus sp. ENV425]|nr:hypothetical protein CQZ88_22820 [Rhodococcus sp. ENV425]
MIGLAGVVGGAYVLIGCATAIRLGFVAGWNTMTNEDRRDPRPRSTAVPEVMADLRAVVVTIVTAG